MSHVLNFRNWQRVYEQKTSEGGAIVNPLGTTGISAVTFPKDGISFSAPDSKPYILLINDEVEFQGYVNNQTISVTLEPNNFQGVGAYKKVTSATSDPTAERQILVSGVNPSLYDAVNLMSQIVTALYGGVTADRVMQTVKAMKAIKNDFPTEIANNSLFANLRKKMAEVYNSFSVQKLYANMGNKKVENMQAIFDGVTKAFKEA
jgi:hypothetical protein